MPSSLPSLPFTKVFQHARRLFFCFLLLASGWALGEDTPQKPIRAIPRNSGNSPPVYPAEARRLGQQGQVMVHVKVGADGTAQDVSVKQSSGFPLLDEAALAAVRRWKFDSGADVEVPVRFSMK